MNVDEIATETQRLLEYPRYRTLHCRILGVSAISWSSQTAKNGQRESVKPKFSGRNPLPPRLFCV